jgi:hypothetical protein
MEYGEEKTRGLNLAMLRFDSLPAGWTVYRAKTRSSLYTLGLFTRSGERHIAILRGRSNGMGQDISAMDSDPRIDGLSLFDAPMEHWIGKSLAIGTITTSPLESVEKEHGQSEITSIVAVISQLGAHTHASSRPPPPERAKYPLSYVEDLESTAAWLRRFANQPQIAVDIAERREWTQRVKIAMVNARQALEDLAQDEHFR